MTTRPIHEQIQTVRTASDPSRQSYKRSFGEDEGKIPDSIAARDIARLEAVLGTLKRAAIRP
jgi:hypothetical protein